MNWLQKAHEKEPGVSFWPHDANPGAIMILFDFSSDFS